MKRCSKYWRKLVTLPKYWRKITTLPKHKPLNSHRVMETYQFFSDDIVIEILTFLPAKSLMRFKCVSKAWNTLIRHPNFVQLHYARSQARPSATRLLFQLITYGGKQYCQTNKSEGLSLQLDYFCYDGEMTICSNHCNGLVCLYSYTDSQAYLYNVTTREIKPLPTKVLSFNKSKYPRCPKLFLGFDHVTGNYKLLHCLRRAKEFQILTLGVTNSSWRKIHLSKHGTCYLSTECSFLNGVLYWTGRFNYVAYFNFSEEKFGYLSPTQPSNFIGLSSRSSSIRTALWGKLAIYCCYVDGGPPNLLVYDEANKVFGPPERTGTIKVVATLLGEERINDETKAAHVLATTSVISAPASLLSSSSSMPNSDIRLVSSFVKHHNNNNSRLIFASSFVENIIPLTSLLV